MISLLFIIFYFLLILLMQLTNKSIKINSPIINTKTISGNKNIPNITNTIDKHNSIKQYTIK